LPHPKCVYFISAHVLQFPFVATEPSEVPCRVMGAARTIRTLANSFPTITANQHHDRRVATTHRRAAEVVVGRSTFRSRRGDVVRSYSKKSDDVPPSDRKYAMPLLNFPLKPFSSRATVFKEVRHSRGRWPALCRLALPCSGAFHTTADRIAHTRLASRETKRDPTILPRSCVYHGGAAASVSGGSRENFHAGAGADLRYHLHKHPLHRRRPR
jgi:hypothetical protein